MRTATGVRRRIIAGDDPQTLAGIGEFGLIAELTAALPAGPRTLVGIGDDAAVLATPDGRVVATTDFMLEGRHFRRDTSSARDVGHKAAARSLADVAAMGAVPSALLVALAAPADLPGPTCCAARWPRSPMRATPTARSLSMRWKRPVRLPRAGNRCPAAAASTCRQPWRRAVPPASLRPAPPRRPSPAGAARWVSCRCFSRSWWRPLWWC